MNKLANTIFIALIYCCFFSCNNSNNELSFFYETGELKEQYELTNGKKNGKYVRYYKDGKVAEKASFINDKPCGIQYTFYENGKLKTKREYLLLRDEPFKNWFISYDSTGNTIQKNSHFYKAHVFKPNNSEDSIILEIEINPFETYDRLLIFKGNYNANYYLSDSLDLDTIDIKGKKVKLSYAYDSTKDNVLRGKVFHYQKVYTENGDSLREGRFLYFSKKIP